MATYVSIRSPYRSKGRWTADMHHQRRRTYQFQSAPLTEARGDRSVKFAVPIVTYTSFNPLPLPKQGEM